MNLETLKSKLSKPDSVPEGWHSRLYWQRKWGVESAEARRLLGRALEEGLCTVHRFLVKTQSGAMRKIEHYKFREGA